MNPLIEVKNDISGAAALADWLGDNGSPVSRIVAEYRSNRCTAGAQGSPCPLNVEPNWWDKVKGVIADWIRAELEIKHRMQLKVTEEEHLNMCKACGCCLRLKVWVPREHLKHHITKKQLAQAPEYCWMKKEIS